jgi:hypothetical protein
VRAVLGREENRGGERSGEARGGCSPFYRGRGGHAGARSGETAGGNGLNAIDGGRLNEGLRGGELKWGIKAGSEDLAWHLEVGGRAAHGGRRRQGEAATSRPAWGRG